MPTVNVGGEPNQGLSVFCLSLPSGVPKDVVKKTLELKS